MANTKDIRRRIKSIRNIGQLTKAMQMVAASKMRKAQNVALAGRPYSTLMNRVLVSLQQRTDSKLHPLLQVREVKKELVVVISTEKLLESFKSKNAEERKKAIDSLAGMARGVADAVPALTDRLLNDDDALVGVVEVWRDHVTGGEAYQQIHAFGDLIRVNHYAFGPGYGAFLMGPVCGIRVYHDCFRRGLCGGDGKTSGCE